jgi:hypothetical protein
MNSRMKEAIATGLLGAARDEARNALDYIEAEIDKDVPPVVRKLARAESDYAAAKRAEFVTIDESGLMTREQCEAAKARAKATVARASTILGPYAVRCDLQQFKDSLRHIDPVEVDVPVRPDSCLCGTEWTCKIACTCAGPDPDHAPDCHYGIWEHVPREDK